MANGFFTNLLQSDLWGKYYQSEDDVKKKTDFILDNIGHSRHDILNEPPSLLGATLGIEEAITAFGPEIKKTGYTEDEFKDLLFSTVVHESGEGKHRRQRTGRDIPMLQATGKARGLFMVEPSTAKDLITADGTRLSKRYFGKKADKILVRRGLSTQKLFNMDLKTLGDTIQQDATVGALFATAKYLSKLPKKP